MQNLKNLFKKINLSKFDHIKAVKFVIVALSFVLVFSFSNNLAKSSTLDNLTGAAWGMDEGDFGFGLVKGGMEWLSFNCTIHGGCSDSNYGVNYDINTGYLEGYAYSAHYGWVKFGGLNTSEMPSGPGTSQTNAYVDANDNNKVKGWVRFCAPAANQSLCTGVHTANAKNGGWDGWLSLRGTGYGVTYDSGTKEFGGYAWGGNNGGSTNQEQVVGWVDFSNVSHDPINEPMVTISAQDIYIPEGGQTTIFWDGLNLINSPSGCLASQGAGSQNTGAWISPVPEKNSPSGTFNTGVLNTKGDYIYEIKCLDTTGTIWSTVESVTVHVGIRLFLSPDSFVTYGPNFNVDLTWYSDAPLSDVVPPDQDYCIAEYRDSLTRPIDPPTGYWKTGNFGSTVSPQTRYDFSIANISAPVKFDLKCYDGTTLVNAQSVYVNKGYNEDLTFSNTKVVNNKTTLKWIVVGMQANSCVPTYSPNNPSWETPNPKDSSDGTHEEANIDVPAGDNNYTITCTGNSGSTYSATLTINPNSGNQSRKYKEN